MPALQNRTHQPAEAPFTSQGSQDLMKLLPISEAVSLSDLNIKYKWQFIISISLQMFLKWFKMIVCQMNAISIRLMVIAEQQELCLCQFLLTNTVNQAKFNKSMLQRPPSHLAEKTVLLPCKLRKPELSLHGQRKSLPSSGSDHLVLEMISMSHEYNLHNVQVVVSWRLFALKVPCTLCFLGQ